MMMMMMMIMMMTQVSAIWNDETGIEALKKEEARWIKKSRWGNIWQKNIVLLNIHPFVCIQVEVDAGGVCEVLPHLVLSLLQDRPGWQAVWIPHLRLANQKLSHVTYLGLSEAGTHDLSPIRIHDVPVIFPTKISI